MRLWFSGRMRPCQGRDGSSILPSRTGTIRQRSRGEMDITTRFGRVIVGSSPAGSTLRQAQCKPRWKR